MIALLLLALAGSPSCDPSLLAHTYKPTRLIVITPCLRVTGTIVDATHGKRKDGVRMEKDGDTHGYLKVDPEFESLLNNGNRSHEAGNLVFEIVCYRVPTQKDAVSACRGYHSPIVVPPVGSHVAIVGVYVEDENHAHWREQHPVTSITVLR